MVRILGRFLIALLLILPSSFLIAGNGGSSPMLVRAEGDEAESEDTPTEDVAEGEETDEATVESEEGATPGDSASTATPGTAAAAEKMKEEPLKAPRGFKKTIRVHKTEAKEQQKEQSKKTQDEQPKKSNKTSVKSEEEDEEDKPLKASPDADTHILFTKPTNTDFPAGAPVRFLVGFTNKGEKDFTVDSMEGSFRYPQDFSFYIQNFTYVRYDKTVEPSRQATFEYGFTPSETFSSRPFGLVINLNYKDSEGNLFRDAVFNETVTITEPDEGFDGETFFLYLFLAAVVVLLIVGAHQLFTTFGKKRLSKPKQYVEMGTQNKSDVDYDWIPKENLEINNKSPRTSPRSRKSRRAQQNAVDAE